MIEKIKLLISLTIISLLIVVVVQNANIKKIVAQNAERIDVAISVGADAVNNASAASRNASEASNRAYNATKAAMEAAKYASNCPGN